MREPQIVNDISRGPHAEAACMHAWLVQGAIRGWRGSEGGRTGYDGIVVDELNRKSAERNGEEDMKMI